MRAWDLEAARLRPFEVWRRHGLPGGARPVVWGALSLLLLVVPALTQRGSVLAGLAPDVRLGAHALPLVEVGGSVSYTVDLSNWGFGEAHPVLVTHTLPEGFSYQGGSTEVSLGGDIVSLDDPVVEGRSLTWGPFTMPGAVGRFDNHYGIHTFVQDLCVESYVDFQLDKALDLAGVGGHVTQLFYPVTVTTNGPDPCWVYFVEAAYDRTLVPIVRLQGEWGGDFWIKPERDGPGDYTSIAEAFKRVVKSLPRRDGHTLYVQVWNEPDVSLEWSGEANASEYGHFFVDVAQAIHSIGDPRIKVLNGALTPGNSSFTRQLTGVPLFAQSFDLWASHCYPYNHPPEYNIHAGTARYPRYAIDCYLLELQALDTYGGRRGVKVMLTETGYSLYDRTFRFEGYPAITEDNRAYYMKRAFRDFWATWPEVVGVTPFELVDPYSTWRPWDWIYPGTDQPHKQYSVVKAVPKPEPLSVQPSDLVISFAAQAAPLPGTYRSDVAATVDGANVSPLLGVAPVMVVDELRIQYLPLGANGGQGAEVGMEVEVSAEPITSVEHLLDMLELLPPAPEPVQPGRVEYLSSAAPTVAAMEILARIELGPDPQAIALDPSRDRAYVTLGEGVLATLDTHADQLVCTVPVGRDPQGVAVNASTGSVYVANQGDGTVSEVTGAGCGGVATIAGLTEPVGLVVDEQANRIFVSDSEAGHVVVLNGDNRRIVGRVPVGSHPESLAFDQVSGLLYVANAGDGTLSVIRVGDLSVVSTIKISQGPLLGLAADAAAGRAYVVHLGPPPSRQIAVVDGRSGEVTVSLAGSRDRQLGDTYTIAVDEGRELLYVADGQELLVLETRGWALSGSTPVDAVTYNHGLAVDPARARVYLLDSLRGELVILGS